jgi:hypothetical protein
MMIRTLAGILLVGAAALVAGCNDGNLEVLGNNGSDTPTTTVDPNNPHNGGQDVDPPTLHPTGGDQDGDGIPDGQDNIPCGAYYLKVWNQGVSSASVTIDADEVVAPSAFPTNQVLEVLLNPVPGTNTMTLGARLAGSPGDELHLELWDMNGTLYLHETVLRGNGHPDEPPPVSFNVSSSC